MKKTLGVVVVLAVMLIKILVEMAFVGIGAYYVSKGLLDDPLTFTEAWRVAGGALIIVTTIKQVLK